MDKEVERIIRNMSGEELALWIAHGGYVPPGCVAIFEAAAIRRETVAELVGRPRHTGKPPAAPVARIQPQDSEERRAVG